MSDTAILPTQQAGDTPPGVPGSDWGDDQGDDRRRLMIIGGGVLAVLVIVVAYLLLHGGGSSSTDTLGTVPRGTPQAVTSTAPSANNGASGTKGHAGSSANGGSKAGTTLPKPSHRQLAKDPWKPLVTEADTASNGTTTSSSGATPGAVPTTASSEAPGTATGPPLSIRLVKIVGSTAVFDITYSHHQVFRYEVAAPGPGSASGTVFAQDFSLLGVQPHRAATIQVGDDTPFDLKVGASHAV